MRSLAFKSLVSVLALAACLTARAAVYYVGPAGSDSNAGSESAPFASLTNALAQTDVTEIRLLEGDYTTIPTMQCTRGGNFAKADIIAEVTKAVKIVGAGREKTFLRCRKNTNTSYCGIYLNNKDASLTGVTVRDGGNKNPTGGNAGCVGWGIDVAAGIVSNCAVICGTVSANEMSAFAVSGANAFAYDCVISNHHCQASNMKDALVYVSNGLLQDSLITDCWGSEGSKGFGLYVSGGTVRRCDISYNDGKSTWTYAGGVYIKGGTLADSRIAYNHHATRSYNGNAAGGCYSEGGTVTNCLFVGNRDEAYYPSGSAGGLYLANDNAKAYDCTFVENTSFTGGAQFRIDAGTASNMLVERLNGVPTCEQTGGTLTGLLESASPGFRDRVDFELPYASAYRTAGWHRPSAPTGVEVALLAGKYCYRAGENVVVTAKVTNGTATGYAWKVTTASGATTPTAGDELTLTTPACGDYTVEVEAKNGDTSLGKASIPILVRPAKCYVKPAGGEGTWPYDSTDNAPCTIQKAVDAVYADEETQGEIEIATGTYANLEPRQPLMTKSACRHLIVTKNVRVFGETDDPDDVWVKVSSASTYITGGIVLANRKALMTGLKLTSTTTPADGNCYMMSHGLQIGAGTVSNVVVAGCSVAGHFSAPVNVEKNGLMTHSVVRDNKYPSGCGRLSCGVVVRNGGRLLSSSILRNYIPNSKADQLMGGGVYMTGSSSVVSNCLIEGNSSGCATWRSATSGGLWMDSGTAENCIIQCNTNGCASSAQTVGGVYFAGGTLRNCLVAGNYLTSTASDSAGGLYINTTDTGAKAHHLTVVRNSSSSQKGVVAKGTALAASVVANNGTTQVALGTATPSYCCFAEATAEVGTGNSAETINFVDSSAALPVTWETASSYGITKISAGYNMVPVQYATVDLLGVARPVITAESTDFPDCGALEVVKSTKLEAFLVASAESYGAGETAVFTVTLDGPCTDIKEVTWTVTINGATTVTKTETNVLEIANLKPCDCTVSVVVENTEGVKTEEKSITRRASPRLCYVALGGKNVWPYDTEAIAASNIADAIEAVYAVSGNPGRVIVLPGTYDMAQKMSGTLTFLGVLGKPVHVIGRDGPEATVIRQTADGDSGSGFKLSDAEAVVSGLTVMGSYYNAGADLYQSYASAFMLTDGLVTNCVARGLFSTTPSSTHCVPAFLVKGGKVQDCKACGSNRDTGWGRGAPIYLVDGLVSGCEVYDNFADGTTSTRVGDLARAGGVYVTGGVISNSVIRGNRIKYTSTLREEHTAGGVMMTGGEMWNCVISCNTNASCVSGSSGDSAPSTGVSLVGNAKMYNCLVVGNYFEGTSANSPAVQMVASGSNKPTAANVTVTENKNPLALVSNAGLRLDAGTLYNSIVWGNESEPGTNAFVAASATASHCCYPEATEGEDGNISAAPRFRKWRTKPCYHLSRSSPCHASGLASVYDDRPDATDLAGRPRVTDGAVDMGCYEDRNTGFAIFFE